MELTKERKASPPDAAWPAFEYGNPGSFRRGLGTNPNPNPNPNLDPNPNPNPNPSSFRRGLGTLPDAISAALGQPVGSPPQPDARVRLQWKLSTLEREGAGFVATS